MTIAEFRRTFVPLCALLLAAAVAACSGTAVAPEPSVTPPSGSQAVAIPAKGVTLEGRLFGAEYDVGVVLSHMLRGDQTDWFSFADDLATNGYGALTYNFRGYGESGGEVDFGLLDEDLLAAVAFLREQGVRRIFIVGASMGATTSLVVAAREDTDGVVALSPPSTFAEQDALAAAPDITEPKLLLASEELTGDMVSLEELYEAASQPKERETYSGNAHGTDLIDAEVSEHDAAVRRRVLQFLKENSAP